MSSYVKCKVCGSSVPITEIDEFTPTDENHGINLPFAEFDEDEAHIFRGEKPSNLFIHYAVSDDKNGDGGEQ